MILLKGIYDRHLLLQVDNTTYLSLEVAKIIQLYCCHNKKLSLNLTIKDKNKHDENKETILNAFSFFSTLWFKRESSCMLLKNHSYSLDFSL